MTPRFTKAAREAIARDFAARHGGQFDAGLFLQEVRARGAAHPAYAWFQWDREVAFERYQLEQARDFVRDLRVTFRVEEVTAPHAIRVREAAMPLVLSPLASRAHGGGYVVMDPDDPRHLDELCRQAAKALDEWQARYAAALGRAKIKPAEIERISGRLAAGVHIAAA